MDKLITVIIFLACVWIGVQGVRALHTWYESDLHLHIYVHKDHNLIGGNELNETYPHNHKEEEQ